MSWGPVQILVLAFDEPRFTGEIVPELTRLREADVVRLVDMLVVSRDEEGNAESVEVSDLTSDQRAEFGAMVGALIGLGESGEEGAVAGAVAGYEEGAQGQLLEGLDTWDVVEAIPPGGVGAIALLEHRWAIPLRDAVERAGGAAVVDAWVHASDLVALGAEAAAAGASG